MTGEVVAEVVASRAPGFAPRDKVTGMVRAVIHLWPTSF